MSVLFTGMLIHRRFWLHFITLFFPLSFFFFFFFLSFSQPYVGIYVCTRYNLLSRWVALQIGRCFRRDSTLHSYVLFVQYDTLFV